MPRSPSSAFWDPRQQTFAAECVQRWWRGVLARRAARERREDRARRLQGELITWATVEIQRWLRGVRVRFPQTQTGKRKFSSRAAVAAAFVAAVVVAGQRWV
eukprot:RCo022524